MLERLQALSGLFAGDFLDGLEIDRSPLFNSWLIAQRRRFSSCHAAILEHLVANLPADSDDVSAHLDKWLELAPFDSARACWRLLTKSGAARPVGACEEHLGAAARLFQSEELDFGPVREAWRAIRDRTVRRHAPGAAGTACPRVPARSRLPRPAMPARSSAARLRWR